MRCTLATRGDLFGLGEGYEVRYRRMPQDDDPSYARWSVAIGDELTAIDADAIVVGHSVGGSVIASYHHKDDSAG